MEKMPRMKPRLSVVIPAYNAETTIAEAVRAVVTQPLPRDAFECFVVDDASGDQTSEAARHSGAVVVRHTHNRGPGAARNTGVEAARGEWIVFTDADCVPSRRWLPALLTAAQAAPRTTLALAGKTIGLNSQTPPARFMDLIGSLDAEIYLRHEIMPWAPSCNLACRRADLLAVGGFDPAFLNYETPELHLRLLDRFGGAVVCVPTALVMHRHRATWVEFWRQQAGYGRGYAHFLQSYADRWPWSLRCELAAWGRLVPTALRAIVGHADEGLVRRGIFLKQLAQRVGFSRAFYLSRSRKQPPPAPRFV
jgi:glycosyltransferase involved in cell wall biosynthesis